MTPFQGKEATRLSSHLSRVLDPIEPAAAAGFTRTARAVADLSRLFTKERDALDARYLNDPVLAKAYLSYYLPVNLSKIQVLLDELPEGWHRPPEHRALRVLDLGAGPGTGSLAVLDWLNQHDPDACQALTVVAVDASAEALREARRLWAAYVSNAGRSDPTLIVYEDDLAHAANNGWRKDVARGAPYDLIIVANCLNELFGQTARSIKKKVDLTAFLLTLLAQHGTLMIVEPALRETSRALHQVRDRLLQDARCTVYSPCLHERNCPALVNQDDWCHEERDWQAPSWIRRIDHEVGFIKDALKFSYLLLRTDGRTIATRSPQTFRMVSELRKLKGDTRAWLCNELGRSEVGRLDREESDTNVAWNGCQRGTIVRIEGVKRKEGALLGRIPTQGTVEIVRPL